MTHGERSLAGVEQVLIPYTSFEAEDLSRQLNYLVTIDKEHLALRGLSGVLYRYAEPERALAKVKKGQSEQDAIGHYAVVDRSGDVRGSASIYPNLELSKQRIPLPPILAKGFLSKRLPKAEVNVHAWTTHGEEELLSAAYRDLLFTATGWWKRNTSPRAWTLEPNRSPKVIHDAIALSGLQKVAIRRYDDKESKTHIPARSSLYASLQSEWLSVHGKEKELSKGVKSFWTKWDDEREQQMPISPR